MLPDCLRMLPWLSGLDLNLFQCSLIVALLGCTCSGFYKDWPDYSKMSKLKSDLDPTSSLLLPVLVDTVAQLDHTWPGLAFIGKIKIQDDLAPTPFSYC